MTAEQLQARIRWLDEMLKQLERKPSSKKTRYGLMKPSEADRNGNLHVVTPESDQARQPLAAEERAALVAASRRARPNAEQRREFAAAKKAWREKSDAA